MRDIKLSGQNVLCYGSNIIEYAYSASENPKILISNVYLTWITWPFLIILLWLDLTYMLMPTAIRTKDSSDAAPKEILILVRRKAVSTTNFYYVPGTL